MASFRKIGRNWFYRYVNAEGLQRERKGCPDRRETEGMAAAAEAAKIRCGYIDPKAVGYLAHEARGIADHLADFRAALLAKGGTVKHATLTKNRVEKLLTLARTRRIPDLSLSKTTEALATLRGEGLGPESVNHHVRAVKAFSRWLWRDGRAREHHLAHLATVNPESDRRYRRRPLTPEEAALLVQAAERGPTNFGMSGPDRARCYALALGTGLRAAELASLTPERFHVAGDAPTVTLHAAYAKNGREAVQPLPPGLAARLAPWLATKPAGQPVFKLTRKTAAMIRVDLEAAGIPYETDSGVCDFHALRGAYISNLVASGASVKVCQNLARHSTPSLTIGIYARASLHDMKGAVDALPDLRPEAPKPEAMSATGTEGRPIDKRLSLPFPYEGDGSGRELAARGDRGPIGDRSEIVPLSRFVGSCRELTRSRRPDSNRGIADLQSAFGTTQLA